MTVSCGSGTFFFIGFSLEDHHFGVQLKGLRDLLQGYAGRYPGGRTDHGLAARMAQGEVPASSDASAPIAKTCSSERTKSTSPEIAGVAITISPSGFVAKSSKLEPALTT